MKPDYLDAAEQLAASLLNIKHVEKRTIAVARIVDILAAAVDHSDAYEPLTTCASNITEQTRKNINAQIEEMNGIANEQMAFSAPRFNPVVQS
jgi:hypothetical protein